MKSQPLKDLNSVSLGTKPVTIHLPKRQVTALEEYCIQHSLSPDAVVVAALCAMIEGFEQA